MSESVAQRRLAADAVRWLADAAVVLLAPGGVCGAFPDLVPVESVFVTSLANTNAIVHPPAALLSAGPIETRGGGFGFYADAFSPGAGRLVERIDAERLALLDALGLPITSAIDWFRRFYADQGMHGETIAEQLTAFAPFRASPAPDSLQHRYFQEDVPFGLVPMASLARLVGRPASIMEAAIALSSIVCGADFWAIGRTTESLGFAGFSAADLLRFAADG